MCTEGCQLCLLQLNVSFAFRALVAAVTQMHRIKALAVLDDSVAVVTTSNSVSMLDHVRVLRTPLTASATEGSVLFGVTAPGNGGSPNHMAVANKVLYVAMERYVEAYRADTGARVFQIDTCSGTVTQGTTGGGNVLRARCQSPGRSTDAACTEDPSCLGRDGNPIKPGRIVVQQGVLFYFVSDYRKSLHGSMQNTGTDGERKKSAELTGQLYMADAASGKTLFQIESPAEPAAIDMIGRWTSLLLLPFHRHNF